MMTISCKSAHKAPARANWSLLYDIYRVSGWDYSMSNGWMCPTCLILNLKFYHQIKNSLEINNILRSISDKFVSTVL